MSPRETDSRTSDSSVFYQLLSDVIKSVSEEGSDHLLFEALNETKDYFAYGSAFIYEHDPFGRLVLQEHTATHHHDQLPGSFSLETVFDADQSAGLAQAPFCYTDSVEDTNSSTAQALCDLFGASSLCMLFIFNESKTVIGCMGMADKRKHLALEAERLAQLKTILIPFAEHARFRIYQRKLEYTTSTLESIMDHIGFDIYVNDFDTHEMLYANKSMAAPYGGWDAMKNKTCFMALYDDKTSECEYCPKKYLIDKQGNPSKTYSWDYQRPFDGEWFRVISAAFQWTDGRLAHVISSTNISAAKSNELLVERMAYTDMLTGIPNRRRLETDIEHALANLATTSKGIAILFLDLDKFKEVNDIYGHSGGDLLLQHVSQLFQGSPLTANHCYRYGGDEFIFLFENMDTEEALERGRAISTLLSTPVEIDGDTIICSGSIGFAHYPEDGSDYWTLLDTADAAMYRDKDIRKTGRA
ncbi:MAG: GGDEF domain-containing protein [Raoultibacter sp.]